MLLLFSICMFIVFNPMSRIVCWKSYSVTLSLLSIVSFNSLRLVSIRSVILIEVTLIYDSRLSFQDSVVDVTERRCFSFTWELFFAYNFFSSVKTGNSSMFFCIAIITVFLFSLRSGWTLVISGPVSVSFFGKIVITFYYIDIIIH